MKTKLWIGIDPGKDGGISGLYNDGRLVKYRAPQIAKQIDIQAVKDILLSFISLTDEGEIAEDVLVLIEDVHAFQLSGASSSFNFGRSLGILEGIVVALGLPYVKVQPKAWQKLCFQGVQVINKPGKKKISKKSGEEVITHSVDNKGMALVAVRRLFPGVSFKATERSEIDHDGIVDSVLIAHYGKITFKN